MRVALQPPTPVAAMKQPVPPLADDDAGVLRMIDAWRSAWERGDARAYLAFYDAGFKGEAHSRAEWERQRTQRLANGRIQLAFYQLHVALNGPETADVHFVQAYSSGRHSDHGEKRMKLRRVGDAWKIVQETWTPR